MAECLNEEEVELSLGLAIGGRSLKNCTARLSREVVDNGSGGGISEPDSMMNITDASLGDVVVQTALRRREARKKQQVRRGVLKPKNAGDFQALKSDNDDDERVQKKTKSDFSMFSFKCENGETVWEGGGEGLDLNKCDRDCADMVPQFPTQLQHLASAAREIRNGGGHLSFRPFQAAEKNKEAEDDGCVKVASCCSSGHGSINSSDCGSLFSQQKAPMYNAQVVAEVRDQIPAEQSQFYDRSARLQGLNIHIDEKAMTLGISAPAAAIGNLSDKNVTRQSLMARNEGMGRPALSSTPLAKMPCVSTTGTGPEGKTVRGFLYRYTKEEVCIVCVCHGCSFSPAKFVEHAGGRDVENPLRHITVIPSAPSRPTNNNV
ncbi:unnamed protein product [Rhodiola kirilowii]